MDRRSFLIAGLSLALEVLALCPVLAQTASAPKRVGMLINGGPTGPGELIRRNFVQDLAQLGYVEDRDFRLDPRFAEGVISRLPVLAGELVQSNPDIVVAFGGPAAQAAAQSTSTIPIVFSFVTDPVALGLVASLDKPGRNVTGVTSLDPQQATKQMELLKAAFPGIQRIAILSDTTIPGADVNGMAPIDRANLTAANALGLQAQIVKVKGPSAERPDPDFASAFTAMKAEHAEAVLVLELPVAFTHRRRISDEARTHRIPAMFPGGMRDAGGVITYGTSVADTWRRLPAIVDKIFKGTKPAEIPVEFVKQRELVFNLKTATEIGVAIPEDLLAQGEVIR